MPAPCWVIQPAALLDRNAMKLWPGATDSDLTPDCAGGCASMRYARVGMIPAPMGMMMRCASGARKLLKVQPMVVSGVGDSGPLVVYLFDDTAEQSLTGVRRLGKARGGAGGPLTPREIEVLRYLALGWDIANIAAEMGAESPYGA